MLGLCNTAKGFDLLGGHATQDTRLLRQLSLERVDLCPFCPVREGGPSANPQVPLVHSDPQDFLVLVPRGCYLVNVYKLLIYVCFHC